MFLERVKPYFSCSPRVAVSASREAQAGVRKYDMATRPFSLPSSIALHAHASAIRWSGLDMKRAVLRLIAWRSLALITLAGCTSGSMASVPTGGAGNAAINNNSTLAGGSSGIGAGMAPTWAAGSAGGTMISAGGTMMTTAPTGAGGSGAGAPPDAGRGDAGSAAGAGGMVTDSGVDSGAAVDLGPKNGDPSKPMVELAEVPCRTEAELSGQSRAMINATIDGRELIIDYPCGKHEGAQMTVILNLHGTLALGAPFTYQRSYFAVYRLASSHNLIVIHPQSRSTYAAGAQWGNEDNGTDTPHLNAVMTWVYDKFSKFNIRSTWIAGHSWGAAFAEGAYDVVKPGYVCNEMFKDKFKGVIGLSYIGKPPCADRVSMIGTQGEQETFERLDQSDVAAAHGCDLPMKGPEMVGNNERRYFDGCDPGWVHEDWRMLGKGHIDSLDREVLESIIGSVKGTEL